MQANFGTSKRFTVKFLDVNCAITEPDAAPTIAAALSDVAGGTLAADADLLAATTLTQLAPGIYEVEVDLATAGAAASNLAAGTNFRVDLSSVTVGGAASPPASVCGQVGEEPLSITPKASVEVCG